MYRSSRPAPHSSNRIHERKQRTVSWWEKTAFKRFYLPSWVDDEDRKKFHSCLKAIIELGKVKKRRLLLNTKTTYTNRNCLTKTVGIFLNKLSRDHYYRINWTHPLTYYPGKYSTPGININLNSLNWFPFCVNNPWISKFRTFQFWAPTPKGCKKYIKKCKFKILSRPWWYPVWDIIQIQLSSPYFSHPV